jgi:hypothetical protein
MLSGEPVDEEPFHRYTQPFVTRSKFCQFRGEGLDISEVDIRAARERPKSRTRALDAVLQPTS